MYSDAKVMTFGSMVSLRQMNASGKVNASGLFYFLGYITGMTGGECRLQGVNLWSQSLRVKAEEIEHIYTHPGDDAAIMFELRRIAPGVDQDELARIGAAVASYMKWPSNQIHAPNGLISQLQQFQRHPFNFPQDEIFTGTNDSYGNMPGDSTYQGEEPAPDKESV